MGEKKKKDEALRATMLRTLDLWAFPPSDWETQTLSEIRSLPILKVERASAEQLAWARMKERLCHDNCAWYANADPEKLTTVVHGWIFDSTDNYVLHSVIQRDGRMMCITPVRGDTSVFIDFIPDPEIIASREDTKHRHHRRGMELGVGLRSNPDLTIANIKVMRGRLESGMDPLKAMQGPYDAR